MLEINMIGQPCPIPVIEAKKALLKNESIVVIVDNIIATQNLEKLSLQKGCKHKVEQLEKDLYKVFISNNEIFIASDNTVIKKSIKSGNVFMIGTNIMGNGDEKLGKILMKGFIYSLTELTPLPESIIFFNTGVYNAADGSDVLDSLALLEEKGVNILNCGTCLDFYNLKNKLKAGSIVNMYDIVTKISEAEKVINI